MEHAVQQHGRVTGRFLFECLSVGRLPAESHCGWIEPRRHKIDQVLTKLTPQNWQIEDDGFEMMFPWTRRVARAVGALLKLKEPGYALLWGSVHFLLWTRAG